MNLKLVTFTGAPCEQETSPNLISRSPGPAEKSATTVPSALRARAKPGVPTLLAGTELAAKNGAFEAVGRRTERRRGEGKGRQHAAAVDRLDPRSRGGRRSRRSTCRHQQFLQLIQRTVDEIHVTFMPISITPVRCAWRFKFCASCLRRRRKSPISRCGSNLAQFLQSPVRVARRRRSCWTWRSLAADYAVSRWRESSAPARRAVGLFEARERLGGRILSVACADPAALDLGPTWFWPNTQPLIKSLVAELGLADFPQHDEGAVLHLRDPEKTPERIVGKKPHEDARRLPGRDGELIDAAGRRSAAGAFASRSCSDGGLRSRRPCRSRPSPPATTSSRSRRAVSCSRCRRGLLEEQRPLHAGSRRGDAARRCAAPRPGWRRRPRW